LCFAANSDDSNLEEVQLDDNGNNGSSQDVEETEEDAEGREKGNSEEFNVEDCQKKTTLEECQLVRPFIDTHTMDKSEPLENLQMFHVEDEGGRSQNDNGNRDFENLSYTNVRKEDEATFIIDGQNLSDALDDKAEQICTINNSDVIGHLCSDEDTYCRRVDKSNASVQNHENTRKTDAELLSNSKCKSHNGTLRTSEWQECFSGNRLIVVNQGDGGVGSVLRQGHQERLHLKWRLQEQVSPQDWISLCNLSEYHHNVQHTTIEPICSKYFLLLMALCKLHRAE
jgi:hypothetical protein